MRYPSVSSKQRHRKRQGCSADAQSSQSHLSGSPLLSGIERFFDNVRFIIGSTAAGLIAGEGIYWLWPSLGAKAVVISQLGWAGTILGATYLAVTWARGKLDGRSQQR